MFYKCESLKTLEGLENWKINMVIYMQNMFYACINLQDITALTKWFVNSNTAMQFMFAKCDKLNIDTILDNFQSESRIYKYFSGKKYFNSLKTNA